MDSKIKNKIIGTAVLSAVVLIFAMALFAGSVSYWQGWLLLAILLGSLVSIAVWLGKHNPKLFQKDKEGIQPEKQTSQQIIKVVMVIGLSAILILSFFDHRYSWSSVPTFFVLIGDVLVAQGLLFIFNVIKVNTLSGAATQLAEEQTV